MTPTKYNMTMHTQQKETPTSGASHLAGVNTLKHGSIIAAPTDQVKHLATLMARAALAGYTVQKLGGSYMFSRWGHVAHCADLETVEQHLQRIGA
ncbi:MAG: hypothetical protein K9K38_07610 [Rhodoferax sp.]|nr:hypothetical protein [Rhodoferax sp.]